MPYKQIPPAICRKFFDFPEVVPEHFKIGFMPNVVQGSTELPDSTEVEVWCRYNLGKVEYRWARRGIYFFCGEEDAFIFKMRWC